MLMRFCVAGLIILLATGMACAETSPSESPQLKKCLQRADDLPDMAAAEADIWIKKGGGNEAHLCRAFAQANRGMHADAAREFWLLAAFYDKQESSRAISMHNMSGQEFLQDKDIKNAEAQFISALKIAPDNVDSLIGRAQTLMANEKYWEALDDLTRALKIKPDSIEALRQRGSVWTHLSNDKNAQEDFELREALISAIK